jgi:hypothetical protein
MELSQLSPLKPYCFSALRFFMAMRDEHAKTMQTQTCSINFAGLGVNARLDFGL